MLLGSPVTGYIHPKGWPRPAGNSEYVIVRGMADHMAAGQGKGTDIGNAKCGGPCFAKADGVVYSQYIQNTPGKVGHGSLIQRVVFTDGSTSGDAHLASFSVKKGATVKKGQQIGVLGGSGGVPCHLHTDYRLGKLASTAVDFEKYLEQNHNLQLNAGVTGVNLREGPDTSAPIWASAHLDGIWRNSARLCDKDVVLQRRPTVTVVADGYEWMPMLLPVSAMPLWVARPFIHFL
jgi:hypothetical protein